MSRTDPDRRYIAPKTTVTLARGVRCEHSSSSLPGLVTRWGGTVQRPLFGVDEESRTLSRVVLLIEAAPDHSARETLRAAAKCHR